MKLLVAILLVSGLSLARGGRLLPTRKISPYSQQQGYISTRRSSEVPVDKFNFIDLELLQLAADSEAGNIVLSPASVKTTLSMLWEGAGGNSADEIGLAMRLSGRRERQEDQLHQYQQNLTARHVGSGPSSTLELASQVFASDRVEINPKYVDDLANYHATVQKVNMSDAHRAAATVNQWVDTATHGLVPSIVQPESLSNNPVMVLTNAVYFRGTWQTAFDEEKTQEASFCGLSGPSRNPEQNCMKVEMMETMGTFRSKLISELDSTLIELPYDDGRYSMLILLPERKNGMRQLVRDLTHAHLLHVVNNELEESEYVVSIPKFSIEFNTDLVPVLNKLKVVDIFTPAANLSGMIKQDTTKVEPAVSNIFHKAKILVDERGAIAAGVSGALVVPLMGGPQPRFRADHPFLFFIRDMQTGGFLFTGRVSQPQPSEAPATPADPAAPNSATPATTTSKRNKLDHKEPDIKFPGSRS